MWRYPADPNSQWQPGGGDVFMAHGVNFLQVLGIGGDGFFLEIADHAMGGPGRQEVEEKVEIIEYGLGEHDDVAFQPGRLGDLHEGHQVHAFILGFIQQFADPAPVVTNLAQ